MRSILIALAMAALVLPSPVSATWSIIAIDRATGRMVISSATCTATRPNQLKQLQAIVIPGVGVAAAQAGVDRTHENQKLIYAQISLFGCRIYFINWVESSSLCLRCAHE